MGQVRDFIRAGIPVEWRGVRVETEAQYDQMLSDISRELGTRKWTDDEIASKLDTLAHEMGRSSVSETLLVQEAARRLRSASDSKDQE